MKKLLIAILAMMLSVVTMFSMTACNDNNDEKPTITIGYTDYPPMNYEDENGKLVGFDTELAEKVFGDLGYEVRFKLIDWSNKYIELDGGTIDCVWNGFTANVADDDGIQRKEKVSFTYNYMTNAQCIIRLNSSADLNSDSAFAGTSVAFEASSAGESYVNKLTGVNKKSCSNQMAAIMEVKNGTAQYAVVDLLLAKSIAGKGDYQNVVINQGITIDAEYYAIAFKKGSDLTAKVNEKIVAYAADGSLKTLADKYNLGNQVILDYADQIA